jgi:pimeloyl-ACP methyl ester carboxylesterase
MRPLVMWPDRLVDIDLDKNTGFPAGSNGAAELATKQDVTLPGKFIQVDSTNLNGTQIPDFAVGFNSSPPPSATAGTNFVPITLTLPQDVTVGAAQIRFVYSASDPALLTRTGTGTRADPYLYHPDPTGTLRIWAKPESYVRNAASIASGGDYLPNNQTFNASALTWSNGVADLYVEAVSPSLSVGGNSISVQVVPSGGPTYSDYVRYTAISTTVAVDANRSGGINFDGSDLTTPTAPYRFWLNNSTSQLTYVGGAAQYATVVGGTPDFTKHAIVNQGDLQNFAPLDVQLPLGSSDGNGNLKPGWSAFVRYVATSGAPSIDLYDLQSTYATNFLTYLTDPTVGSAIGDPRAHSGTGLSASAIVGGTVEYLPVAAGQEDANHRIHFIFGGDTAGAGALVVQFKYNGNIVSQDSLNLSLSPITQLYEQATVINPSWVLPDGTVNGLGDLRTLPLGTIPTTASVTYNPYSQSSPEDNTMIVFVHGWRMKVNEMEAYADTAFKRLYWQGYTGRFTSFSWPTEWVDSDSYAKAFADPYNYDNSELKAWYSAPALYNLLVSLDGQYGYQNVNIFAHSMGNVVTSEALRMGATAPPPAGQTVPTPIVNAYVATQAATPAQAYDRNANSPPGKADVYSNYGPSQTPYFSTINLAAPHMFNFYNSDDHALSLWLVNQAKKPDAGYEQLGMSVYKKVPILPWLGPKADLSTRQRFEAFAFGVQNLGTPLGATGNLGGPFNAAAQVDLNKTPYSFGTDHSGEFDGTESWRRLYWNTLVTDFGMKPWSL